MSLDEARQQVVEILNDCSTSSDAKSKLELLGNTRELILFSHPSLLPEYLGNILEFQFDRFAEVRRFIAAFCEDVVKMRPTEGGVAALQCLAFLAGKEDEGVKVLRRVISGATSIFHIVLKMVCDGSIQRQSTKEGFDWGSLWESTEKLKNSILAARENSNDGIKAQAQKFAEHVILTFSPPEIGGVGGEKAFHVGLIPAFHSVLSASALKEEAESLMNESFAKLEQDLPSSVLGVIINGLATIARARPSKLGQTIDVLSKVLEKREQKYSKQKPKATLNSVKQALKSALLLILKAPTKATEAFRKKLVEILTNEYDAETLAKSAVANVEKSFPSSFVEPMQEEDESMDDVPQLRPSDIPPDFPWHLLPSDVIADVIIANLSPQDTDGEPASKKVKVFDPRKIDPGATPVSIAPSEPTEKTEREDGQPASADVDHKLISTVANRILNSRSAAIMAGSEHLFLIASARVAALVSGFTDVAQRLTRSYTTIYSNE